MAKVGSKTLVHSLKSYDPAVEIYQTHTLTPEGLSAAEAKMEQLPGRVWAHLDASRRLSRRIRLDPASRKWRVISPIRDPVARDVSYFFECLEILWPEVRHEFADGKLTVETLARLFLDHLDDDSPIHFVPRPVSWFDVEVKPLFGIDVYSVPFAKERGFQIYAGSAVDLLVLKLEHLNRCITEAAECFLQISDFALVDANTSQQKYGTDRKAYYKLYEQFKKTVRLPEEYLDTVYDSSFVQHFYTDGEIESFRTRWQLNGA